MIKKAALFLKRFFTRPEGLKSNSTGPVSRFFGTDRGTPIDRYFICKFLEENRSFIKGAVLEIAESTYSKEFGAGVSSSEILHITADNPNATIIGDLTRIETLPCNTIDCFICTQTFNFIYDFKAAIEGARHLLKPGGVLLATVAGISQISTYDMDRWGDYWRFTQLSAKKCFEEVFGIGNVTIDFRGNCLATTSFLRGIAAEEVGFERLNLSDKEYPLIITIVAKK